MRVNTVVKNVGIFERIRKGNRIKNGKPKREIYERNSLNKWVKCSIKHLMEMRMRQKGRQTERESIGRICEMKGRCVMSMNLEFIITFLIIM